jgi:hypothetical protein
VWAWEVLRLGVGMDKDALECACGRLYVRNHIIMSCICLSVNQSVSLSVCLLLSLSHLAASASSSVASTLPISMFLSPAKIAASFSYLGVRVCFTEIRRKS